MSTRRPFPKWTWLRRSCALTFLALLALGAFTWFPWFKGSVNATQLFDVIPFVDPLVALEYTAATRQFDLSIMCGALILFGVCLLLGPVFCGWVCPLGLVLDMATGLRKRVVKKTTAPFKALESLRFGLLGMTLALSLVLGLPIFQAISPINFMSWLAVFSPDHVSDATTEFWAIAQRVLAAGGGMLLFLGLIVVVELVLHPFWCRTLCPLGALYSLIGTKAFLKIKISPDPAACKPCNRCTNSCPMGISVMQEYTTPQKPAITHPNCTRCGACIDACPNAVLKFRTNPRGRTNRS